MERQTLTTPTTPVLELHEALEGRFHQLIDHAVIAGWTRMEVAVELAELAYKTLLAEVADNEIDRAVQQAWMATKQ